MPASPTVLHYVGANDDRGGIVSVVRALAGEGAFRCILGVNAGCVQQRTPALEALELPSLEGETIGLANLWRARGVAYEVWRWLQADPSRVFHGHSRAGLLVGLWLNRWQERRVVVSVHCYGRQRWFYRWAAGRLGKKLFWLTPAMRRYYGVGGEGWAQCIPSCTAKWGGLARNLAVASDFVRLGGIGTLVEWKGWHLVLDAMKSLPAEMAERVRFSHIGSTDGSTASEEYAARLYERSAGVGAKVEWRGQQENVEAFLGDLDALVLPSHNEPFSLAMLEALQAGVPVLRADSGGAVDVIEPGVNGWLFRTGDAADLARVLRSLVETEALAKIRIDAESLRRFSAPVVAAQWAAVYARVSA